MRAVPLLLRTVSGLRRPFRKLSPILRPAGAIDENPFFLRTEVLFAESAAKVFSRAVWFLLSPTGHSIVLALCRLPSLVCSTIATSSAPVAFSAGGDGGGKSPEPAAQRSRLRVTFGGCPSLVQKSADPLPPVRGCKIARLQSGCKKEQFGRSSEQSKKGGLHENGHRCTCRQRGDCRSQRVCQCGRRRPQSLRQHMGDLCRAR
jgi:hypothetical protein